MAETVIIARRFRGPATSGNGGYTAGLAARALGVSPAEVTLLAPPPLDAALEVVRDGSEIALVHAEREVVRARPAALDFEPPPAPARRAAAAAEGRYVGFGDHPAAECFVCGPFRRDGDGLRLFAGPLDEASPAAGVAALWTPRRDLADEDGLVAKEMLWAALDCPSYFALPRAGVLRALLGRITAEVRARPRPGDELVVAAWPSGSEGRKHAARSAIYGPDGRVIACASCLWIELRPPAEQPGVSASR